MQQKKHAKKKYEKPVVVRLGDIQPAAGRCHTGYTETGTCAMGPTVGGTCRSGGAARN